jgi:hypothetical protein
LVQTTRDIERREIEESEITLIHIAKFFRANWKFLVLLALGLSVIAVTLVALLLPHWQYRKELALSVRPTPSELVGQIEQESSGLKIADMSSEEAGQLAVGYLSSGDFGNVEVDPTFRPDTQQVRLNLQSADRDSLEGINYKVIDSVKAGFQGLYESTLSGGLEARISSLEHSIKSNEEIVDDLEREIDQVSTSGTEDASTAARLEGLEVKRADVRANRTWAQNDLEYLEQSQKDLSQLATEPIAVNVLSESDVQQQLSKPFVALVALAIMSSLVVAGIVTVIRAALRRAV